MELSTRRIVWFGVTENPNQEWVSQQARNLTWELEQQASQAKFLICDNDKKFPFAFEHVLAAAGVRVIRTPLQAPKANAHAGEPRSQSRGTARSTRLLPKASSQPWRLSWAAAGGSDEA